MNQTYIIVKPPPTSSKNPLNLQIQLVVRSKVPRDRARSESAMSLSSVAASVSSAPGPSLPSTPLTTARPDLGPVSDSSSLESGHVEQQQSARLPRAARSASRAGSVDSAQPSPSGSASEDHQPVQPSGGMSREGSRRSSVSGVSGVSGRSVRSGSYTGSMASTATSALSGSTATGSGGAASAKRIQPLFNLAVHNVMQPSVVTDAHTDVKVAKVSFARVFTI